MASILKLKNIQGTTIENIWKMFFFSKKSFFFKKKVFTKTAYFRKTQKGPVRLNKYFLQTENFKKLKEISKIFEKLSVA